MPVLITYKFDEDLTTNEGVFFIIRPIGKFSELTGE